MMNKKLVSITLCILFILLISLLVFYKVERIELPPQKQINTTHQPTLGHGKIRMVAFEDMKCSNCKIYNEQIYPYIKSHYIDTGDVSYTVIPLAFIYNSMPAGNAALCAYHQQPALFFSYIDYLYQHQPNEALDWATPETLKEFAEHIPNITMSEFQRCINNNTYYSELQTNLSLAGQVMGDAVQTPSLFINGYLVSPMTITQIDKVMEAVKH